jgi:hypothetical protein
MSLGWYPGEATPSLLASYQVTIPIAPNSFRFIFLLLFWLATKFSVDSPRRSSGEAATLPHTLDSIVLRGQHSGAPEWSWFNSLAHRIV